MGEDETLQTAKYVLFRLGEEEYGLPVGQVNSIIRYEQATPVPRAPEVVEGVINLRGRVIPVVNLRERLLGAGLEPTHETRIVVAESAAGPVGLIVDAAQEVAELPLDEVRPAPEVALGPEVAAAFTGVVSYRERLVILLDLDHALPRSEYARAGSGEGETDV